jgi:hypothetical protein
MNPAGVDTREPQAPYSHWRITDPNVKQVDPATIPPGSDLTRVVYRGADGRLTYVDPARIASELRAGPSTSRHTGSAPVPVSGSGSTRSSIFDHLVNPSIPPGGILPESGSTLSPDNPLGRQGRRVVGPRSKKGKERSTDS